MTARLVRKAGCGKAYDICQGQSGAQLCCARSSQAGWRAIKQDPAFAGPGEGQDRGNCLQQGSCGLPVRDPVLASASNGHSVLPFLTHAVELQHRPVLRDSLEVFFLYIRPKSPTGINQQCTQHVWEAGSYADVDGCSPTGEISAAKVPLLHIGSSGKADRVSLVVG